jgi:hypothetical protein
MRKLVVPPPKFLIAAAISFTLIAVTCLLIFFSNSVSQRIAIDSTSANADASQATKGLDENAAKVVPPGNRSESRIAAGEEPSQYDFSPAHAIGRKDIPSGISFPNGTTIDEVKLAGLEVEDAWGVLKLRKPGDPGVDSACAMIGCRMYSEELYSNKFTKDPTYFGLYSLDHVAFVGAICQPLVDQLGLSKAAWDSVTNQCTNPAGSASINALIAAGERLQSGEVSDADINAVLFSEHAPLGTKLSAIERALKDERVLLGLDWNELRGELPETSRGTLAALIAAKTFCKNPSACRPRSFLIFQLCSMRLELDCSVNSSLSDVARNSLTPRQYKWWELASFRKGND